jgi:hypothetical protein
VGIPRLLAENVCVFSYIFVFLVEKHRWPALLDSELRPFNVNLKIGISIHAP